MTTSRERAVDEAARQLEGKLEAAAESRGSYASGRIEPRGDYFSSESDPSSRGKYVEILLARSGGKEYRFRGLIERGSKGWEGGYQIHQFYGSAGGPEGSKRFASKESAISFIVKVYKAAWDRYAARGHVERKSARRDPRRDPAAKKRKIQAFSEYRYRASAAERRMYGGSTVTQFIVYRDEDRGDASKWKKVVGYGKTPGERKTDAIRRSGFLSPS